MRDRIMAALVRAVAVAAIALLLSAAAGTALRVFRFAAGV